ncbi:Aldo/keto reductase family protein [Amycolatopsis rubida]|uniref:Aldo/keto reductase family protein n=1 Tax=Amycolatopsis rubida TaxID=112413 RepID=A0A1I5XC34_9PSEU|nr:Aldo/keto reductase family protein [Amycolatopsis rubida]
MHSLDPARLREAVERSADDLGRSPDVVFLHNPELGLSGRSGKEAHDRLADASAVLASAVAAGSCGTWGIATWDARPVAEAIERSASGIQPGALLLRAGLSVAEPILAAGETLCRVLGVPSECRWGMSPFSGSTADPVWSALDLGAFLAAEAEVSTPQAAFRLAYELPPVTRVAVGTSNAEHLRDLVHAAELAVSEGAIRRYRELIKAA